ncbi:MAG: ATP-binding protein [Kiritimatiellae bacterium]|nr:ATP-binding protein [Kiritimatiellia bacterium]
MDFFGREGEIGDLMALWGKRGGSLVTCRGRRRIGKSTLIEMFAKKSKARFIRIEGVRPKPGYSDATELKTFARELAAQTRAEDSIPDNWLKAFIRLDREINDGERTVVLLDEVSWLGHYDETFADLLKIAWDDYWSRHDRLIVVVCGSVSGWIKEHFVENGAFFGRRSLDIVVKELPLKECVKFWGRAAARVETREIVDVLSVTGGVPRYLKEIDPGASASENIARLAFRPNSILRIDFDEMFSDVITKLPTLSGKIVRALAGRALSVSETAAAIKAGKGGKISEAMEQLEEAGLVASDAGKNPETGHVVREARYRLKDNYSRFYLRHIEPRKEIIDSGAFRFVALEALDGWDAIMGLQFENLVLNHFAALIDPLHIGNSLIESAAPYSRRRKSDGEGGLQIDLLLQTKHSNYVVEIKRKREIGREVIDEVEGKISKLSMPRGKSARPVLVYDGALAPIVETEGFFDAIVPFSQLLGL